MLNRHLNFAEGFLLTIFLWNTTLSLGFGLNAYSPEMCFILNGSDVGKHLSLNYSILTDKSLHIHFTVYDIEAKELIFEEKREGQNSVEVSVDVNFLHNFEVCWKNMDSEEKRINFTYKHSMELPLASSDVENHFDMMEEFLDRGEDISDLLLEENNQQERYHALLENHEDDINRLFFFKALFLLFIVIIQVFILSSLVDSNVKEIKTIVIGPN